MKISFLSLIMIFALVSCETKNNCEDLLCDPIPFVALNIVDAESGENLFQNGTYTLEDVELINENNESILVRLDAENNLESAIGDIEGNNEYRLLISQDLEINITTDVAEADESCCSSPTLVSFNVLNYDFEETSTRIYTIFID